MGAQLPSLYSLPFPSFHPSLPLHLFFLVYTTKEYAEALKLPQEDPGTPGRARPLNDIWCMLGCKSASDESSFSAVDEIIASAHEI